MNERLFYRVLEMFIAAARATADQVTGEQLEMRMLYKPEYLEV